MASPNGAQRLHGAWQEAAGQMPISYHPNADTASSPPGSLGRPELGLPEVPLGAQPSPTSPSSTAPLGGRAPAAQGILARPCTPLCLSLSSLIQGFSQVRISTKCLCSPLFAGLVLASLNPPARLHHRRGICHGAGCLAPGPCCCQGRVPCYTQDRPARARPAPWPGGAELRPGGLEGYAWPCH